MTPLEIVILLHHHCSPTPYPHPSPAATEAQEKFVKLGILKSVVGTSITIYSANLEATQVYVDAVCAVPLPIKTWSIPYPIKK